MAQKFKSHFLNLIHCNLQLKRCDVCKSIFFFIGSLIYFGFIGVITFDGLTQKGIIYDSSYSFHLDILHDILLRQHHLERPCLLYREAAHSIFVRIHVQWDQLPPRVYSRHLLQWAPCDNHSKSANLEQLLEEAGKTPGNRKN